MSEADEELEVASGRALWSGTVTFGLVSIPVNLLPANRPKRMSLRMVSEEGRPLKRRYFTSRDGKPLEWSDIVRGYEVEKGRYVVLDEDELERLAPEKTRDIDLRLFVPADEIKPRYFDRAYFLTPDAGSNKAYRLLAQVMEETGRAGIATFVMRSKEYLTAIFAENGILRAETLRFADEIRDAGSIGLPEPVKPKPAEVKKVAAQLRKLKESQIAAAEMKDPAADRMLRLVKQKLRSGEDVVDAPDDDEESTDVIDLLEVLQRRLAESVDATGGDGKKGGAPGGASRRGKASSGRRPGKRATGGPAGASKQATGKQATGKQATGKQATAKLAKGKVATAKVAKGRTAAAARRTAGKRAKVRTAAGGRKPAGKGGNVRRAG
jgi:DNA end-binding protein Ku